MIILESPVLKVVEDEVVIISSFQIENERKELWYKFPLKYQSYLVTERSDAFLIGLLFLALKTGNDIKINGTLSSRLYYTINHYLIDALCLANPQFKKIKIIAESLDNRNLNGKNKAGTGLSCGIDSFATYFDHKEEKEPYRVDYFTFFNVGSHGDFGGDDSRTMFWNRFSRSREFSKREDKELISVDSNLSEILRMNFQQTNTLRTVSCVLHFQKLFRVYYLASKNRFDYFKLHTYDTQDYDSLILNMLSTESTDFFSAVQNLNRIERTEFVSGFPETYDFLDVCTDLKNESPKINCTRCEKCLRTALTLDLLGTLEKYDNVFSLEIYYKLKSNYIGKVIALKNKDQIYEDIFQLLQSKMNLKPLYIYSFLYSYRTWKNRKKKWLKRKLNYN